MERTLSNPKREALKTLSDAVKPLAIESQTSINAALLHIYAEQTGKTPQDFKTFDSWKAQGFLVKKGQKVLLFGQDLKLLHVHSTLQTTLYPRQYPPLKKGKKSL